MPPSGMPAVPSADDATLPPTENLPSLPQAGGERLDFLAPPQGPGEIGRLGAMTGSDPSVPWVSR